jgi:hypothetical protein
MNALVAARTTWDLAEHVLWSTQQPRLDVPWPVKRCAGGVYGEPVASYRAGERAIAAGAARRCAAAGVARRSDRLYQPA